MFCCQSSFSRREHDKSLLKNVLSESEQNLNKFKFENSSLYFSEPNIFETKTESGERRKWKTSAEIGFHVDPLPKFKTKFNKREVNESGTQVALRKNRYDLYNLLKRKATSAEAVITPHRSEIIREKDNKTLDTSSLNSFLSSDVLFLNTQNNEIVNSSQEFYKEKKDYDSAEKGFEDVRSEFKKSHLKRKIGFKSHKPAKNESILDDVNAYKNTSETFENDVLHKNESVINFAELSDARVLQRVSSKFDVSCKSNLNHVNEFLKETDNKLAKAKSRKLKQEKLNSGTLFLSFCSLFHLPKASNEGSEKTYSKNNKINFKESYARLASQQNVEDNQSDFCPVGCQKNVPGRFTDRNVRISVENAPLIIKPPKFRNEEQEFFHQNESNDKKDFADCRNDSLCRHDSRIDYLQSDVVAPGATQFRGTNFASSKRSNESVEEVSADEERIMSVIPKDDSSNESQLQIPTTILKACLRVKHRLLLDGDVQVCYLNHKRTVLNKVLTSKFLRKWETHHIILGDDSICSKTPTGFLTSPIPYSAIEDLYAVGRWDQANRFCIRLATTESSLLLQTNNSLVRDWWLSSILWKKSMCKYKNILKASTRPEVILKEIKSLVNTSLNCQLQDDCIMATPIKIISNVLKVEEICNDRQRSEEVIIVLAPLIENSTPSPEMFRFFSGHCVRHPKSPIVVNIFTGIVNRILKHTADFGRDPLMRQFVVDYLTALHLQNDGDEVVRQFVIRIHGPSSHCPHPRVLPNMVAVNLAAVFSHFEEIKEKRFEWENKKRCPEAIKLLDKRLECYLTLFQTISEFEDWRPGLAQLLQPIPFPDEALKDEKFVKGFTPVVKAIAIDSRCEVHEKILGIRENKKGWLNIFCPSYSVCQDEGILWSKMLKILISCCCRRKSFLESMVKHLGALMLVALRDHEGAQEILCLMLEWHLVQVEDKQFQVVATLQSTQNGRLKYEELCKKQEHLTSLQKKAGPKKLTLPNRSTDDDVARLMSCGSFGNLEHLSLAFTHVTSSCAQYLIQLPKLRILNLWATQFGDDGLILIAEYLENLQELNLCETPVSDKGIVAIIGLKNLRKLNLNSTKLKLDTLEILKEKLPALEELDVRYTEAW